MSRILAWPAAGAAAGGIVGSQWGEPLSTALGAGLIALWLWALVDALRAAQTWRWLAAWPDRPSPVLGSDWADAVYRVERLLRRQQSRIEAEQDRLQQFLCAFEVAPVGLVLLDEQDCIQWCNAAAQDHLGVDASRDGGQRLANLVRAPVVVAALAGSGAHEPIALPRPDGQGSLQVLLGVRGAGQRLVMSLDVTAREQAEAMRRDFVANVSHEIRTPLTVLSGFIESMHRLPMTVEERERVLGLMGQQARRLQALVTDLLALSRLEGSPRPAVDQWFELDPLLQRVRADAEHSSGGRHRLSFTGPAGLHLAGNEAELHSALDNLIVNALRYTPEGGSVDLRWTLRDDGSFQAEVLDTGIGIAREHLPRLTERFYRVDSSRSRDSGGTGLGLAIVKHVVQRHGGDLDIRSEPGVGSRFTLVLPALRARQSAARDPVPARL